MCQRLLSKIMANKHFICVSCGKKDLDKDTVGINRKLLGMDLKSFYCMDCLADYLGCTVQDIKDKIVEFKEEGCRLFE